MKTKEVCVIETKTYYLNVPYNDKDDDDTIEEKAREMMKDEKNYINEDLDINIIILNDDNMIKGDNDHE